MFHASLLASQGHNVLIVGLDHLHVRRLINQMREEVPPHQHVRIVVEAFDPSVNLIACTSTRHKNRKVLIDHIVLEAHLARVLKMLMQYEAPENSNVWYVWDWAGVATRIE